MEGGYLTRQEWMLELDLKGGNELDAYALVFGFCKDGKSWYQGSASYVARWLKCSRQTAMSVLSRLVERGYLEKRERFEDNVKFVDYRVTASSVQEGCQKSLQGGVKNFDRGVSKNLTGGVKNFDTIIIEDNEIDKSISTNKKTTARARKEFSLPYNGKEFLEVWAKLIRQPKWLKKSDDAIEESIAKLAKVDEGTAIEMMRNSIERNWQGVFYPDRPKGWQRQAPQGESREAKAMREANEALQRVADRHARETGGGSAYDGQQLIEFDDYDNDGDN